MRLDQGKHYRYCPRGEIRSHRGLIGVASNVESHSAITYSCTLSNFSEWEKLGIAPQIKAMSTELEPAEAPAPTPPKTVQKLTEGAFAGMECDLVALIEHAAQERGYKVAKVGQHRADGSGTTVGYPDLSFRRAGWPCGMACLIEVKTATGVPSPEQERLHESGWSFVVRSVREALEALETFGKGVQAT